MSFSQREREERVTGTYAHVLLPVDQACDGRVGHPSAQLDVPEKLSVGRVNRKKVPFPAPHRSYHKPAGEYHRDP